jgi:hypothetical protein
MIEYGFVFDVYELYQNDYSSSEFDEQCARVLCETTVQDCLESDGGYSIGCRLGDPSKQDVPTFRRFEGASNVTDVSDSQLEKQRLHTTSTDAGTLIVFKPLHANADSSIRCNLEFNSNATDVSELQ